MLDTSARLLRLLSALQARRYWTGPELAEHLGVTARTLRRDVDRLRSLGYAVEGTAGPGGGYQLGTGAAMPPLLLDDDEAAAVAVSLRSAADTFLGLSDAVMGVLVKLEQVLPRRLRRRVSALQAVTMSVTGGPPTLDARVLTTIAAACRDDEQLEFVYRDHAGEESTRRVEPLRLAHNGTGRWYLVAWDLDREDWRTFRVDRVDGCPSVGPRFVPREPPADLAEYVARSISHSPYEHRASIKLRGSARALATRIPPWCGVLEPLDDESCVLRTGAGSIDALVCMMLLTGTDFELIEPPELAPELRRIARRLERATRGPGARRPRAERAPE
jgi:predicted DNA-binding transcriptional regulator YafY